MFRSLSDRHPLVFVYLFFLYFSGLYQLLIVCYGTSGGVGLRHAMLMSVLWLIPVLLWPRKTRLITAGVGCVMWATSAITLGYWLIYRQDFSQSVIFIIFESNFAEGSEFVGSYFRWTFLAILAAYTAVPLLLWRKIPTIELPASRRYKLAGVFVLLVFWPFLNEILVNGGDAAEGTRDWVKGMETSAPWNLAIGYWKYRTQLAALRQNLRDNEHVPPLKNLVEADADMPKTLVLVIGESTNRQRMGLYGYARDTTPNLDRIRDQLIVFDDVVTPRPYTIEALQQALSFANQDDPGAYFERPGLLNMMKQAGYDITWITNQQTQTKRNTMLVTLSQIADHQVYLNNNRRQNSYQFDDAVLEPFANALASDAEKKMIVVHLLGTHRKYTYRYPDSYDRFRNDDGAPAWINGRILDEYNSYDNAVLYNDHVVSKLIESLAESRGKRALVYFSDHGEEVYDTPQNLFSGRNESKPSPAMYTVPFILWASPEYMADSRSEVLKSYARRAYSLSDFIYTWADIAEMSFEGFDGSRSLVSADFREHPRRIGDPGDPASIRDYADILRSHRTRVAGFRNSAAAARQ